MKLVTVNTPAAANAQSLETLENIKPSFEHGSVKKSMEGVKSRDLWQVDPRKVRFLEDFNTRIDTPDLEAHIEFLTKSIMENGFYMDQPVTILVIREEQNGVMVDVNCVTGGHCRTRAALRAIERGAPLKSIPAVTEDRATTIEELIVKLHQSNTGKPFTPFEVGMNCKRLLRFNWDEAKIAKKMGLTLPYTKNLLMLVGSAFEIREAVIYNKISAANAIELLHKYGQAKAVVALQKMLARAALDGKDRVTAQHKIDASLQKAVKKHGSVLYQAAKTVSSDPQFKTLKSDSQEALLKILALLDDADAKDKEAAGSNVIDGEATRVEGVERHGDASSQTDFIEGEATLVIEHQADAKTDVDTQAETKVDGEAQSEEQAQASA